MIATIPSGCQPPVSANLRPAIAGLAPLPVPRPVTASAYAHAAPCLPPLATRSGYTPRLSRRVLAYGRTRRANRYVAPSLSARSSPCPPGLSRRLLTHPPRQSTPTYARRARSGGGACYAPGLSRAVLRKATARASPYADAVRRRIALNVSATVIGRRRLHLPRPLLVCRVPCADVRGSGSPPGDACPPCGGSAERTAKTPTVPGARGAPSLRSTNQATPSTPPAFRALSATAAHATPAPAPQEAARTSPGAAGYAVRPGQVLSGGQRSRFARLNGRRRAAPSRTRRAAPAMLFPPARFSPLHPPFRASPLQKESGRGANLPGGQQHGGLYGAASVGAGTPAPRPAARRRPSGCRMPLRRFAPLAPAAPAGPGALVGDGARLRLSPPRRPFMVFATLTCLTERPRRALLSKRARRPFGRRYACPLWRSPLRGSVVGSHEPQTETDHRPHTNPQTRPGPRTRRRRFARLCARRRPHVRPPVAVRSRRTRRAGAAVTSPAGRRGQDRLRLRLRRKR